MKTLEEKKLTFAYLFDMKSSNSRFDSFKGFKDNDLDKIDIINYSFGIITDGKVDINQLEHICEIINEAHKAQVKVVLSIGGWGVGGFSEAVSTRQSRKILIDSIINVIKDNEFDGVDIDWEYPATSVAGIISSPDDKNNFTIFIHELREELNLINKNLLLTVAVAASNFNSYYEVDKLNKIIDYLHIMTYDMSSLTIATHHTNLYHSKYSSWSVDEAVKAYIEKGMDKNKIVIGVAFYGHKFEGVNFPGEVSSKRKSISNYLLVQEYLNNKEYQKYYDEDAKATYYLGNNTFISHDDDSSIIEKCKYVNNHDLAGVMFWEYCKDIYNTMLNTIYKNLNK